MNYIKVVFITLVLFLSCSLSLASQIVFEDDFSNNNINDASYIFSTEEYVKTPWSIENEVFKTGSSSLRLNVHWDHYVDIRYFSDYFITDLTVSLDYLNTRPFGGSLSIVLGQVDQYGNTLWLNDYRYKSWYTRSNLRWQDVFVTTEQLTKQSGGNPVNMVYVRELDITDGEGSGYIDNIKITGNIATSTPEPASLVLFGSGLLLIAGTCRKFT